jgi:hypothetical protein
MTVPLYATEEVAENTIIEGSMKAAVLQLMQHQD